MTGAAKDRTNPSEETPARLWVERIKLTDFRNYSSLEMAFDQRPVVLVGDNGAGKTNILEAVSLLAAGHGLRRAPYGEIARAGGDGSWAVAARIQGADGGHDIGTGLSPSSEEGGGRIVRVDGAGVRGTARLGELVRLVWLTPAMDGLFSGPASERRRFLDRLIQSLDPGYRSQASRFERAMRQRNRLFESHETRGSVFEGLENQLAEAGVAMAAGRIAAVEQLAVLVAERPEKGVERPFPWATLALEGFLEERLAIEPAIEVEDYYRRKLAENRERDRAAKRTLEGPHRSDLIVGYGPKQVPARACSTGEQKALLVGLVLAHSMLVKQQFGGLAPLLLLDEIPAHLDAGRRRALFGEIARQNIQAWMTGTDMAVFEPLGQSAQLFTVVDGGVRL